MERVYLAQVNIGEAFPIVKNNPELQSIGGLISFFIPKVLLVGSFISFVIIIVAGFGIISAGGDSHQLEGRKAILTYAIIGLILMFGSYWIIQIMNTLFGKPFGGIFG